MAIKKKKEEMPMVSIPADVYEFMTRTMLGLYCSYGYEVKPDYETVMEDAREVFKRTKQLESKEFREWHCKKRYNESSEYFAFLGVKLGEYINDHHNGHALLLKTYETGSEDDEYEYQHHGNLMHEKYDDPYPEYQDLLQHIHNGNQMEKYMTQEIIAQRDKKAQEGFEEWLAMDKDDYDHERDFFNDVERDEAGVWELYKEADKLIEEKAELAWYINHYDEKWSYGNLEAEIAVREEEEERLKVEAERDEAGVGEIYQLIW